MQDIFEEAFWSMLILTYSDLFYSANHITMGFKNSERALCYKISEYYKIIHKRVSVRKKVRVIDRPIKLF